MRPPRVLLALSLVSLFCLPVAVFAGIPAQVIADAPVAAGTNGGALLAADETGLATDINQQRVANGDAPLTVDPELTAIARARSQDQVAQHYFSHTNPEGQTVFDLLDKANIPWTDAGENLADSQGVDPVQAAIDGFSKSAAHRANMLSPNFTRVGVGAAESADGTTILSVVFTN